MERSTTIVRRRLAARTSPYVLIAPFVGIFGLFWLYPLGYTVWLSFTDRRLDPTWHWIGLANYAALLHDSAFWSSVGNTLAIAGMSVFPELAIGLALAYALNTRMRGRTLACVAMLLPLVTSMAAAASVVNTLFADGGDVNHVLRRLGTHPLHWIDGRVSSWFLVALLVVWHWSGFYALIYLAAMQRVPADLYEAAALDGCGRYRQFLHITVPAIRPVIVFTGILATLNSLQLYTEASYIQSEITRHTQTAAAYLGQQTFAVGRFGGGLNFKLGYGSAIATVLFLLILALGALVYFVLTWIPSTAPTRRRLPVVALLRGTLAPAPFFPQRPRRKRTRRRAFRSAGPAVYVWVTAAALVSCYPLYHVFVNASREGARGAFGPSTQGSPLFVAPGDRLWHNFGLALAPPPEFGGAPFSRALLNTAFVAGVVTLSTVALSTAAGLAASKLEIAGDRVLVAASVLMLGIAQQMRTIPLFVEMHHWGWTGHLESVIMPFLVSALGFLLMRGYIQLAVSDEILDAARVDGCNVFVMLWRIVVPMVRPAMLVLGMFTLVQSWNEDYWSTFVLNPRDPVVQVAFAFGNIINPSAIQSAVLLSTLPVVVLFLSFGRRIVTNAAGHAAKA